MDREGELIAAWSREAGFRARNMVQAKTDDSYADFYRRSPYSVFPQQHRVVQGTFRSSMIMVDQSRHELADPAVDELIVSILLEAQSRSYEWNMGSSWVMGQSRTGDLIVVPPGVESRWRVDGPRKLVILAVPVALVRSMLGSDCPADLSTAFEPVSGLLGARPVRRRGARPAVVAQRWREAAQPHVRRQHCARCSLPAPDARADTLSQRAPGAFSSRRDWRCVCDYVEAHLHEEIVLVDRVASTDVV